MEEKEITVMSKSDYRSLLYQEIPERSLSIVSRQGEEFWSGAKLTSIEKGNSLLEALPLNIEEGKLLYLDYPFYPMTLELSSSDNLLDLVEEIHDAYVEIYDAEGIPPEDSDKPRLEDLYLNEITCCRSGNLVAYIKSEKEHPRRRVR